jgi:hypothetical protein
LQGSRLALTGITTDTTNVYFTFNLPPNLAIGSSFTIIDADPTEYNATYIVTAVSDNGLTVTAAQIQGTTYPAYVGGAQLAVSPRNIVVTINDVPDTYTITFITPPSQTVGVTVAWGTNAPNLISANTVAQAIQPVVYQYINSLVVAQPINTLQLNNLIQTAVQNIIPIQYLSNLVYTFTISGQQVATEDLIYGDPEGYFLTSLSQITVTQSD